MLSFLVVDSRKKRSRSAEAGELSLTNDKEYDRFMNVGRKKDFICFEKIRGRNINILEGLELHTRVFNAAEQEVIVDYVYMLQEMGKKGQFKGKFYCLCFNYSIELENYVNFCFSFFLFFSFINLLGKLSFINY